METGGERVSLAGSDLGDARHVCALFASDDEEYRVLLPFVKDGFSCGHNAVHIVNSIERDHHLARLARAGIDTDTALRTGQLDVRSTSETYLRGGSFDQERMLQVFGDLARRRHADDRPPNRIVCRMDWAANGTDLLNDVIEFESQVNTVWQESTDVVICTYHLQRFSGAAVIDILRTHPIVILGSIVQRNPFYAPPEQFLPDFRARRARCGLGSANG